MNLLCGLWICIFIQVKLWYLILNLCVKSLNRDGGEGGGGCPPAPRFKPVIDMNNSAHIDLETSILRRQVILRDFNKHILICYHTSTILVCKV